MTALRHPLASDPLIAEAKVRARRRRLLALAVALAIAAAIATPLATRSSRNAVGPAGTNACGVATAGLQILRNAQTVYRGPGRYAHPQGVPSAQIQCSGGNIWVVWLNGVAASQQSYFGVHSGDAGRTWHPVFAERYFGWKAPHELDADWGPWTVRGNAAYFAGACVACSTKRSQGTVSLYVTTDGGRTFRTFKVPALDGFAPRRIRVSGRYVTVVGHRFAPGVPSHKTATVRVG